MIPAAMYAPSIKFVFSLTSPFESPQFIILNYDTIQIDHTMMRGKKDSGNMKTDYCARCYYVVRFKKN